MIKDLYRMAIFAKVGERGSYSAASVALGLGKSVVGHHVQALEQNLGVRLLTAARRRYR
jgi:DNA-binding transcriptional LysR family regulator